MFYSTQQAESRKYHGDFKSAQQLLIETVWRKYSVGL